MMASTPLTGFKVCLDLLRFDTTLSPRVFPPPSIGLASFTGMLFRRYSADLTPVIKYVVHQLYNGQTTEIIVLRELIWKMAGIEPLPSLSDAQISAMAGGPTLRIEAVASNTRGARLDPGEVTLRGPQRLGKTLLDSSLALPLLIQVAQQRQSCVFAAHDTHLKSLASLYDVVCPSILGSGLARRGRVLIADVLNSFVDSWCFASISGASDFSRRDLG